MNWPSQPCGEKAFAEAGRKDADTVKETLGGFAIASSTAPAMAILVGRTVAVWAVVWRFIFGLAPQTRHHCAPYLAGFTLKNGVPINYFEVPRSFDWLELGFNTFPAYRDGETAWIYPQTLPLLPQIYGVRVISV